MVVLSRIYTRTGDDGTTALGDFSRTSKTDPRLVAYADVDETGAAIGVAITCGGLEESVVTLLTRVQNDLFDVGADLCTPLAANPEHPPLRVQAAWVDEPGGGLRRVRRRPADAALVRAGRRHPGSAYLHVARTVARRAERSTWAALAAYGDGEDGGVNPLTARYLNRLSDLLFVLGRYANHGRGGDVLWQPGGGREARPEAQPEA
ncbi:cob(I)yrinic acid a,c-diamide adenosyltransferase [Angustibacter aerolatus]|uniref:Corrinoid adenosyltransferase n=1 Tax=Angustibacter aerolatus TaxID=1162965 RepID=A0ABQ6JKV2_9ACTN|nr:cob(I)yrinic acid a,c-diamide adenosyltransferase [Angustibacter aerolatus]GMA88628.1 cob(I)yrinic acid a,c-diamide adenosyltransferase [Angustibacter aerolatus]